MSLEDAQVTAAVDTKNDLRKAHFNLGSDSNTSEVFKTTNMERFKKNPLT